MKRILAAVAFSVAVTVAGGGVADAAPRVPGCASKRCDTAPHHRFPPRTGVLNPAPHPIGFGF